MGLAAAALMPGQATAGVYRVANCSDGAPPVTDAFNLFATRGMRITKACASRNEGVGGLIVGNTVRSKRNVKRGAYAQVSLEAPPGSTFLAYDWKGQSKRTDCRYALQVWAEVPNAKPLVIHNRPANKACPKKKHRQRGKLHFTGFDVRGAVRIVHRVVCVGDSKRRYCSASGRNEISTYSAAVTVQDDVPPTVQVHQDTALTRGEWINGDQPVNYDAVDTAGVESAQLLIGNVPAGTHDRPCVLATPPTQSDPRVSFTTAVPCPNGQGQIIPNLARAAEGSHPLVVVATDPAGNVGRSQELTARIDRTAPARVDVGVEGGETWRKRNDFAVKWTNPFEADRAPIVAAVRKLCPVAGGNCITSETAGPNIARLGVPVPKPGEWTVSLWRRDAAGNASDLMASVPARLRYDPEPPQLGFEIPVPSDPTLVAVRATDSVSGVVDGGIELGAVNSGVWQTLPVQREGERFVARIDDTKFAPGLYQLRARAVDHAGNEASTTLRSDGQSMTLNLPVRVVSALQTTFEQERTVRERVRRKGRIRVVRKRVVVPSQSARVLFGESAQVGGRLVAPDGSGIAGANVSVVAVSPFGVEEVIDTVQTAPDGGFRYTASGIANRTLRFVYAGSSVILPTHSELAMTVPASTTLRVNKHRLRNGQTVIFSGPVSTLPLPPEGKLIEMQVKQPGRWQTFKTVRTDAAGQFQVRYKFRRTSGVVDYFFRVRLPAEAGYPFTAGVSRVVRVRVSGP